MGPPNPCSSTNRSSTSSTAASGSWSPPTSAPTATPSGPPPPSCSACRHKGVDATVLLLSHLPSKYAFAYTDLGVTHVDSEKGWPPTLDLSTFDAVVVVDTGTWSQLPGLKDRLATFAGPKLVIDHHLTQEDWATAKLVDTAAPAAGEIVAGLLAAWGVPLTPHIATALFLALVSDTGWFQFSSTRPATLRLAADLIEAGVDTDALQQRIYQNERPQRLALHLRVQQSMQLLADGRVAVMRCTADDFRATGAAPTDIEALINVPLQIRTVAVSCLLTDPGDGGPIRGSLRSKGTARLRRLRPTLRRRRPRPRRRPQVRRLAGRCLRGRRPRPDRRRRPAA